MDIIKSIISRKKLFRDNSEKKPGRPVKHHLEDIINAIYYMLRCGCPWSLLPSGCFASIPYKTVYRYYNTFCKCNVFVETYEDILLAAYGLGYVDVSDLYIDCSYTKSIYGTDCVGRNPTDRGRRATKTSVICTGNGIPVSCIFSPANISDAKLLEETIDYIKVPLPAKSRRYPKYMTADKGYSYGTTRRLLINRGFIPKIPYKSNSRVPVSYYEKLKSDDTGCRYIIECLFGKIDKYRRLILRYESKIINFSNLYHAALSQIVLNIVNN